jgi:hypothetical protein
MQTVADLPAPHTARRSGRSTKALAALATVVALWLGLTAPGQSPVAPVPASQQVSTIDQDLGQQALPDDGRPGRGRR